MSEQVDDEVAGPPANLIVGLVKAVRPRQWVKNILVLAAPLAAWGADVHYDYGKVLVQDRVTAPVDNAEVAAMTAPSRKAAPPVGAVRGGHSPRIATMRRSVGRHIGMTP